jgi:hypothetical protein
MHKIAPVLLLVSVLALLLFACAKSSNPSEKAVEDYLTAMADKKSDRLSALSCSDWQSDALQELNSLQSVKTRLEGLSCAVTGVDGSTTDVVCQGNIIITSTSPDQQLDLSVRTYQVVQQDGKYLVCGYK